jgi:hypothetical protein
MTLQELKAEYRSLTEQFRRANAEGRHADATAIFDRASDVFREIVKQWQANAEDEFTRLLVDLALCSIDFGDLIKKLPDSPDIAATEQNTRPS